RVKNSLMRLQKWLYGGGREKGMNKKKDLDTILQEVLETVPSIEGYTIEGFSITNDPQLQKGYTWMALGMFGGTGYSRTS
ncbi:MAG: hypothetical protein ACXQTM_00655, partial [Methanosarcinales archaeon]